ncbi:MAG: NlpC/P60 family protein [Bacteroidia bacterium]
MCNTFVSAHADYKAVAVDDSVVAQFYHAENLEIDSAANPELYYKVYDWLGTRYKYAGRTKKGIDCSDFACMIYREVYCDTIGGNAPRLFTISTPIKKEELQEGDLIFFKIKNNRISHVGVYLGNDKFAHASLHAGVIISDLNETYYKKRFFSGGRINP